MASDGSQGLRDRLTGGWALAAVLVVVLLGGFVVYTSNRGMEFSLFGIGIMIAPEDDFVEVTRMLRGEKHDERVAAALLQSKDFHRIGGPDPIDDTATALLQTKGFYRIGSQDLIDAIRRFEVAAFDPDREVAEAKAARLRSELLEMMGSLAGPFALPGTLSGATGDFIHALEELDAALGERHQVSGLLSEMWERSLKHESPFSQRWLKAEVTVLPEGEGPAGRILACPQNDLLDGRYVKLRPLAAGGGAGGAQGRARRGRLPLRRAAPRRW